MKKELIKYELVHRHECGIDIYPFNSYFNYLELPCEQELVRLFNINYEPETGEQIEVKGLSETSKKLLCFENGSWSLC